MPFVVLAAQVAAAFPLISSAPGAPQGWDAPPPRAVEATIPPAARGFQAALRSGVQLPWGDASDREGDQLSARYGWQVPLLVDAGLKLTKPVFLGIYAGIGYGQVGDGNEAEAACGASGVSCRVLSYQLGVQGQYHFGPSDRINPWLSAGAGWEMVGQSLSAGKYSEAQRSTGITFLKLGFGLDYRGRFGFGPFVEVSAGRYEGTRTEVGETRVHEGPVDPSAWHGFLTIGARVVLLP